VEFGEEAPGSAPDSSGSPIIGVRLHTRAKVSLSWLVQAVFPVARSLHEHGGSNVYLRRGWRFGPHVDIIAGSHHRRRPEWRDIATTLDAGVVTPAEELSEETYLDQAREFGRLESVPPPYLPMRSHGETVLLRPEDVASHDGALDPLRDRVLSALAPPLMDTVEELAAHPARGLQRLGEAFLALAASHPRGAATGIFSMRSHAEAFLAWAAPSRDVRPAFERRRLDDATLLHSLVEQQLIGSLSRSAAGWNAAFHYCMGGLDAAVAIGKLTLAMVERATAGIDRGRMGPPGAVDVVPTGDRPNTAYHDLVDRVGLMDMQSDWLASYRLLLNYFYQQLPLLTVAPLQRYYMCYALAEAVDEVLGEPWDVRLRRESVFVASGL
jgi:hypothetical protein